MKNSPDELEGSFAAYVSACERVYLEKLMILYRGNVSRAAIDAGLDRRGLQRLIRRHGMDLDMYRELRG